MFNGGGTATLSNTIVAGQTAGGRHRRRCFRLVQLDRQPAAPAGLVNGVKRQHRRRGQPGAGSAGLLRGANPDDGFAPRQPSHQHRQQRPHSRRCHHRPAWLRPHRERRRGYRLLHVPLWPSGGQHDCHWHARQAQTFAERSAWPMSMPGLKRSPSTRPSSPASRRSR